MPLKNICLLIIFLIATALIACSTVRQAGSTETAVQPDATADKGASGILQDLTGTHVFRLPVNGVQRSYTVYVPRDYKARQALPLVIMLHGGGGTAKAAMEETGWAGKAEKEGFLAVFPEAMARDPSQKSSFVRNPQLWNDGSDRFYSGQQVIDDVAFINALLDDVFSRFAVERDRVYITGFSNGASMSFLAGAKLSKRIAAIAPVAGACWLDEVVLEHPVSMYYMTGLEDPLNIIEGGVPRLLSGESDRVRGKAKPPVRDSINKWLLALGCPTRPASISETNGVHIETYGPGRANAEVVYVTVEGLGHTWAGGRSLLPESWVGRTMDRINATDAIWEFFAGHKMQP